MIPIAEAMYNRVATAVDKSNSLANLSEWICKNTRLEGKAFSFKNHEFQKKIVDDQHSRKHVRKCSQVGLSELSVRLTLGFLGVSRDKRAIYTLPTSRFASKFSKDRVDPVLEQSPILTAMRIKSADSAEMKRLGSCTLYMNGTYGQGAAISIPAHLLVHDELDFSDLSVIATYQSRLRHAEEDEYGFKGIAYNFSTPTVNGFGISEKFDISTQNYYFVKCSKCNHNGALDFFRDVRIPGYDEDLRKFSKIDVNTPAYKLQEAYIACPKCGHDMVHDLKDPSRREWVDMVPSAREAGYQVNPFDVPVYNSIPSLLLQAGEYKRIGDWWNFTLGLPYEDADNSFLNEPFEKGRKTTWTPPNIGASGTVAGIDVGKISHLIIIKEMKDGPHVIFAEKIKAGVNDQALAAQLKKRFDQFGVKLAIIDAMPEFSTALALIDMCREKQVYACYYTQNPFKDKLTNTQIKEDESVVSAYKTGVFDAFCKLHNDYGIAYANHPEMDEVSRHCQNLKKIVNAQATLVEEAKGIWVATGEDHYGHAMNYAMIARDLLGQVGGPKVVGAKPVVGKVKMKDGNEEK